MIHTKKQKLKKKSHVFTEEFSKCHICCPSNKHIIIFNMWLSLTSRNCCLESCVLVTQSCLTLCDPMDCSLPSSSDHGFSQARILKWVAISSFRGSSWPKIEPRPPALQAVSLPSEPPGKPRITWSLFTVYCRPAYLTSMQSTS